MSFCVQPAEFYGSPTIQERKIDLLLKKRPKDELPPIPKYLTSLLGPSRTWLIFKKQSEAIQCACIRGCGLMVFAFESSSGTRYFLTCHPKMLWFVCEHRPLERRCTYEVILENAPCKLYFDIEYDLKLNSACKGNNMIRTLVSIVCWNLKHYYNIECNEKNVLNLTSSTDVKFSCHLIFLLPSVAFRNNLIAGKFVEPICKEIEDAAREVKILQQLCGRYNLPEEDILELIVIDKKGLKKCFVDCGVYTRNRHFRLLNCTKLHKNTPLVISKENQFVPKSEMPYAYFLSSLITYFDEKIENILDFGPSPSSLQQFLKMKPPLVETQDCNTEFLNGSIENFITHLIKPHGRIRRKSLIGNKIYYDLINYRFCNNIGRAHISNNVRFIVDIDHMTLAQACHDPDCKGFLSTPTLLPADIACTAADDSLILEVADNLLDDSDLVQLLSGDVCNNRHLLCTEELWENEWSDFDEPVNDCSVPDMNVSDSDFLLAVEPLLQ